MPPGANGDRHILAWREMGNTTRQIARHLGLAPLEVHEIIRARQAQRLHATAEAIVGSGYWTTEAPTQQPHDQTVYSCIPQDRYDALADALRAEEENP